MNTARVAVIDEDAEEATLLLSALGKAGIGALYFRGDEERHLPKDPIRGIRLVFLDLKLLPENEPDKYIPFTVKVLRTAVEIEPNITGIICWTKHPEDIDKLEQELKRQDLRPAFVHRIENKQRIAVDGDIDEVLKSYETLAAAQPGRNALGHWEALVHDAASSTTSSILQLAGTDDEDVVRVTAAIAAGATDRDLTDERAVLSALGRGLVTVQTDEIDNLIAATNPPSYCRKLLAAAKRIRKDPLTPEQRARLNGALLTAPAPTPSPGNVYVASGWDRPEEFPFALDDAGIRGFIRECFVDKRGEEKFIRAVSDASLPCLLELTPACDFAQGKCEDARLLAGLLIKSPGDEERESLRTLPAQSRGFAREVQFTWVDQETQGVCGSYKLIVNARKLKTTLFSDLAKHKAAFRIRGVVQSDLRAWLAAHIARPGYISV